MVQNVLSINEALGSSIAHREETMIVNEYVKSYHLGIIFFKRSKAESYLPTVVPSGKYLKYVKIISFNRGWNACSLFFLIDHITLLSGVSLHKYSVLSPMKVLRLCRGLERLWNTRAFY